MNNALFITGMVLLWLLAIGGAIWVFRITSAKQTRRFKAHTGRKLLAFAKKNDYLLLPKLTLPLNGTAIAIDYLLIAGKYCYCIVTRPYRGVLSGLTGDAKWANEKPDGTRVSLDNPIRTNALRAKAVEEWLSNNDKWAGQFILPIVVIPDDLTLDPQLKSRDQDSYMFKLRYLCTGIANIEKSAQVAPLDVKSIDDMVDRLKDLQASLNPAT